MLKSAVLIDGGYLRVLVQQAGKKYNPAYIEKVAHACLDSTSEWLLKVLYYDCAPFSGELKLPVSGNTQLFDGNSSWLRDLSTRGFFAVRLGTLKFRGFKLKRIPFVPKGPLQDNDFKPDFEQKGVDMRIGLDIAAMAENRSVERVILVTGDTDCIPAMKHARKAGVQVVMVAFPGQRLNWELRSHSDVVRTVEWPVAQMAEESATGAEGSGQ